MANDEKSTPASRLVRVIESPVFRIVVPLLIVAISVFVLHKLASEVHWSDVKAEIDASTWTTIAAAVMWTAVSFLGLSFYDILAVRSVAKERIPSWVAGLAGSSGSAVSNLLGFSYLTGTAVRYRAYASLGLDLGRVAGVIATSWVGLWMGLILLLGVFLTLHPANLSTVLPLDSTTEVILGTVLLIGLAALLLWLARGGRRFSFAGIEFDLPNGRLAGGLTIAGVVDLGGAALTLYVLMPPDLVQSFPYFFVVFVGAVALAMLSHAPGGLGVFEAAIIAGMGAAGRSDVLAALLLYRAIYTILPFLVAVTGLGIAWVATERGTVTKTATLVYDLTRPFVPFATAGIALLAGTILLISGNLPADTTRLGVLRDVVPLSFIEASHLVGSIVGLLLIVISRGLFRKLYRAWVIAMILMVVGFVVSLVKGLDWEEALGLLVTIGLLGLFRSAFYRVESASVFRLNGTWIVSLVTLVVAITWIGALSYSNVEYRDALWWDFAWHSDASRYLRASLVVAFLLAAISLDSVLSNRRTPKRGEPIPDVVRQLVAESEDTEANMALIGDKSFLISGDGKAFIAYADTGTSLITKGEPVGAEEQGRDLIWELRERADREGKRCAFYAVSPRYLPTYLDLGLSIMKIGEVARADLKGFTLNGSSKKGFRQSRNRAEREGYSFEVIPKEDLSRVLPELKAISDSWLASKQGEEKSFSLGGFEESYVSNFDHAVLRDPDGKIVAFANLFQGGNKHELSLDLMRYVPDGPGFAMDALFAEMMLWGAAQGFRWFSLGSSPFSGIDNRQLASFWNRVGGFVYEHGEHFYHFEGLRSFKEKFDPVWEPNYLASPGGLAVPRILYEVNVLVSGGIRGLVK
ncbi:bifunctional lysylphosphatidylglycerol flippase/synthetase MprF [Phaeobacter marinintestinus]|uniref:bifunctional lysylphosphatidylglycerol flippase/synthetase MprF n=1 Tax=Falsiphaeobacter marinintestinus TaxID=1492905 RepID=UPI0011B6A144|nr:bifunctional lysylphosphatidylglycerol flippase/synthetase MprF [Phaeobacter marinintestinus]